MTVTFNEDEVVEALRTDAEFAIAARDWTAVVRIDQGTGAHDLVLSRGLVQSFTTAGDVTPDITLTATPEGWAQVLEGDPSVQFAFEIGANGFRKDGDLIQNAAPYAAAVRRFVTILRKVDGWLPNERTITVDPYADTDIAVGRYVYIDVDGVRYRVYYEEAGTGVPLLLQHTAGADSRQWRHFLADPEMQKRFRMIAYDLPYHGRSLPPLNAEGWWKTHYQPTKHDLLGWIVGLKRALDLDRPLLMGVSVGGQITPEALAYHPDEFRGAVSVNGWYHMDLLAGSDSPAFHHPKVSPEYYAGLMYESTSPVAPEQLRRETAWIYASNAPGVYRGDNQYFTGGHDLRVDGHLIDTAVTPLQVVACEYDPATHAPGGTREIAENIPGAVYTELAGLSHFAMSDDPVRFNDAIRPILDNIAAETAPADATTRHPQRA